MLIWKHIPTKIAPFAREVLRQLEEVSTDSKLEAFEAQLRHSVGISRLCVMTQFSTTLYYLAAAVEGLGLAYQLLRNDMSLQERVNAISSLANSERVLIATRASITHVDLTEVNQLILYDLPTSETGLRQLLVPFQGFLRRNPLEVVLLRPLGI